MSCNYETGTVLSILHVFSTQTVKSLPVIWETRVHSLGPEDPLEKGMATHSSILASKIPWTKEPMGYSPWDHKELDTTQRLTHFLRDSRMV